MAQSIQVHASKSTGSSRPGVGMVYFLLVLLLAYTVWAWGGVRLSFHWAGVGLAGILLAVLAVVHPSGIRGLFRDPVVAIGAAFLVYLAIQAWNAGRTQYFDVGFQRWNYTPPPHPGWPSAFNRSEAVQMLAWFFPAWVVAATLRSRVLEGRKVKALLLFLSWNAGALALFGLIQFLSGTSSIYWIQPLKNIFFASFAYGNHAAPFFVLMGALAAGLAYRELFDNGMNRSHGVSPYRVGHPMRVGGLVGVLLLCLLGANLGLSRTGILLSWLVAVYVAAHGILRGWRLLRPAERLNLAALTLGVACLLYFAVAGIGGPAILREMSPAEVGEASVLTAWQRLDMEMGHRPLFARAAWRIWVEHPWLGVGGWGYKYLVAEHVPDAMWEFLDKRGWANAHCDPLQFLAEFGAIGGGLLLAALGLMVRDALRCRGHCDSLWQLSIVGLLLVVGFSLIDLPFRSPAILYTWVAILAALPVVCRPVGHGGLADADEAAKKRSGA